MKDTTAIRLWQEAIETTVGGDQEGNPYTQTSVFGGFIIGKEIGSVDFYHAKHNPDNLRKIPTTYAKRQRFCANGLME